VEKTNSEERRRNADQGEKSGKLKGSRKNIKERKKKTRRTIG
jgi:hypothetical protein